MTATLDHVAQRAEALALANRIRLDRYALKRRVATSPDPRRELRALLRDMPECMQTAAAYDVVRWVPRVGPTKAEQIIRHAGIVGPRRQLGLLDLALGIKDAER